MVLSGLPVAGQVPERRVVTTAAGERYRAGLMHRWILGRHYRDLWTQPVEVEVLDLQSTAGGLTPLRPGGGMQTRSLRFLGGDGREYAFRSVDKDPSAVLDSLLRETVVADLVQDGISAAHPYGALVAGPLMDAAGIMHVDPRLRVMPDDPALGDFRDEFAGMLGLIEERPDENEGARTAFLDTELVISSERLVERLREGPSDRVDARAYLKARLLDVLLGDWDRHRDQWRWAVFDADARRRAWLPVPRDRDQAFSKFDGLATRLVGMYMPQFVRFEAEYPSIKRLHWQSRSIDRWFLGELDRRAWDEVGSELEAELTDEAIDEAVAQLPPEINALNGDELRGALRSRRDRLDDAWDEFYRILAEDARLQATDADDAVVVDRSVPGAIVVTMSASERLDEPYVSRRFVPEETDEIRVYLEGGNDRVLVQGDAETSILVRLVGGDGDDRFEFGAGSDGVRLYDHSGTNEVVGDRTPDIDTKPYDEWVWTPEDRAQPQHWGAWTYPVFWSSYGTDVGVFIGAGFRVDRFGFRQLPFSSRWVVRAGYAPQVGKGRAELEVRDNFENSPLFMNLRGRMSRLDVLHYYGLGNSTPSGGRAFHEVDLTQASAGVGLGIAPSPVFELLATATFERSSTKEEAGSYFETLAPVYGSGVFHQLDLGMELTFDPLVGSKTTGHRFRAGLRGDFFPDVLDVIRPFGRAEASVSALLASSPWPTLAVGVRASAEMVLGEAPWHEAAFLGGSENLIGYDEQRFAGDGLIYGGAEVRLRLVRPRVIVPVGVGVFGLAEAGRVYMDGDSEGGWHRTFGGGLFFQPVLQPYLLRVGAGSSRESTKVFFILGLAY